ncbi:hypothetical protein [Ramlibacter sp. WS9]|uniref:hypothetical protein n=1 Tax=Ramlibacter sp. WS9 TaxID=1882741 RepID=UPI001143A676|nr:hypothetical protein [Ramlibacter sp. WS9]ROZ76116.1 hypothetical protein EEB15_13215 [Ramlibacter sp. WS9]
MKYASAISAAALAALPCAAFSQAVTIADMNAQDPCRAEVSKFEQAIGFVRQNQGNQAAQDLKEKLLPAKLENELLFKEGYCGLARYLRDKKLNR